MNTPYPGLDADLFEVVRDIDRSFEVPPHTMAPAAFRDLVSGFAAQSTTGGNSGVTKSDEVIEGVHVRRYSPKAEGADFLLQYMHGGGWTVGSIESHDAICEDICAQAGIPVVSVDYSLSPEARYPVALNECMAVFDELSTRRARASEHQTLIILGGDSCGGNLATAMCLKLRHSNRPQPAAQVLIYPCVDPDFSRPSFIKHTNAPYLYTDLMIRFWKNYLGEKLEGDEFACPMAANSLAGLARAFVLTAGLDPIVDEGDDYARRLASEGVDVVHRRADDLIHGFLRFRDHSRRAREEFSELIQFLQSLE